MTICFDDVKYAGRFLLICVVTGCTLTYFTCPSCTRSVRYFVTVAAFSSVLTLFLWKGNSIINNLLNAKLPWISFPEKRFAIGVLITVSYTVIGTVVVLEVFQYVAHFDFGKSGYYQSIYSAIAVTIVMSLFLHGKAFLIAWKDAAKNAEMLQKENAVANYESLKSQLNPHFLFNSLNALTNLVYEDPDKAAKFIKQLSEVYRYVLDTRNRERVDLQEELQFIDSYLFLQKIRFGDNLKTNIQISRSGKIAPLALQLLIENAIKHNVVSSEEPLTITISDDDDFIMVGNNLQKKKTIGEPSPGMGLENICKRYEFLSQRKVEIAETAETFTVKLPNLHA